jgi:zinc protease
MGAGVFALSGLGRMDVDQMRQTLADHTWSANLSIEEDAFDLDGVTSPASLDLQLQVLTAYLSDPGFRSLDARLPTAVDAMYRASRSNPAMATTLALQRAIAPNGPNTLPTDPAGLHMDNAQFQALLRPALRDAPLEVTIVGAVQEKQVVRAIAHTLGALPARKAGDRNRPDTWFEQFPDQPVAPIQVQLEGPQKAMVEDVWPLFTAGPDRRADEIDVILLGRVLSDALFQRVRQQLGKTYTPAIVPVLPDRGDEGYLAALLDASPADAALVQAEIGKTAAALARGEITQAQLDEARAPILAQADAGALTNSWWAVVLDGSARHPEDTAFSIKSRAMIQAVSLDELKAAAARWLTRAPIEVAATPAAAAP